jgi:pantoate--beta-alanine ligase
VTILVRDAATLHQVLQGPRAVVMTMGALHEGHAHLMEIARENIDGQVVATIFVNPLQFGANEDFAVYPRSLDADVELCASRGVDVVFAPDLDQVYPTPQVVTVDPGPLGDILEGAHRPGHFRGVLTVVAKLLNLTAADVAVFGEKDYQQLTLIRLMAADLRFGTSGGPLRIIGVPTVRESDGLAMSSRNRYLSAQERSVAAAIPRALGVGVAAALAGAGAEDVRAAVRSALADLTIDYVAVTDPDLAEPAAAGPGRVLVAARVGATRLIDNVPVNLGGSQALPEQVDG